MGEVSQVLGSSSRDDHAHKTMFQARGSIEHWFKKYKPSRLADEAIVGVKSQRVPSPDEQAATQLPGHLQQLAVLLDDPVQAPEQLRQPRWRIG